MYQKIRFLAIPTFAVLLFSTACNGTESTANLNKESPTETIALQTQSITEPALEMQTLTQAQLYYKCLNTLEYLDQISGSVILRNGCHYPTITNGNFSFDFVTNQYYADVNELEPEDNTTCIQNVKTYTNGADCIRLFDEKGNAENTYTEETCELSLADQTFPNAYPSDTSTMTADSANAENIFYGTLGWDPTGAHELGGCFMPQEMSIGYLENFDNWEITGTTEVQDRTCAIVKGTAESSYGDRFGVSTFEILVDQETGVWMQFEGYAADGTLADYIYTNDMCFGDTAQAVPQFSESMTAGYDLLETK